MAYQPKIEGSRLLSKNLELKKVFSAVPCILGETLRGKVRVTLARLAASRWLGE